MTPTLIFDPKQRLYSATATPLPAPTGVRAARWRHYDSIPDSVTIPFAMRLFAMQNLTLQYVDTVTGFCVEKRIGGTKPLVRAVREQRLGIDRLYAGSFKGEAGRLAKESEARNAAEFGQRRRAAHAAVLRPRHRGRAARPERRRQGTRNRRPPGAHHSRRDADVRTRGRRDAAPLPCPGGTDRLLDAPRRVPRHRRPAAAVRRRLLQALAVTEDNRKGDAHRAAQARHRNARRHNAAMTDLQPDP
nr:MAG TPA: hypothetical protein [Bacteriophage sp.]